jgi:hypothetical protein
VPSSARTLELLGAAFGQLGDDAPLPGFDFTRKFAPESRISRMANRPWLGLFHRRGPSRQSAQARCVLVWEELQPDVLPAKREVKTSLGLCLRLRQSIRSLSGTDLSIAANPSDCREDACLSLTFDCHLVARHPWRAPFGLASQRVLASWLRLLRNPPLFQLLIGSRERF